MDRFQRAWGSTAGERTPLKIQIIGDPSSAPDESPKDDGRQRRSNERAPSKLRGSSGDDVIAPPKAGSKEAAKPSIKEAVAEPQEKKAPTAEDKAAPKGPPKPVTVLVGPKGITVYSDDPAALENAERLLKMVFEERKDVTRPSNEIITIPLKFANAYDLAPVIEEVLYGQQTTSFNFFGDDSKDKEKRAHIVADTRTNNLIVSGPKTERTRVEMVVKKLDVETPDSDVDLKIKLVKLEYAGAKRVADLAKEIFAPYVYQQAQPNQQQQGGMGMGFGPFGMGMGGGRRGRNGGGGGSSGSSSSESRGKITLSVDESANVVEVMGPKSLVENVALFVKEQDTLAKGVHQTTTVVSLKNVPPQTMQRILADMFNVRMTQPPQGQNGQQNPNQMNQFGPNGQGFGGRGQGGGPGGGQGGGRGQGGGQTAGNAGS
jgi:type II secretory pathway component GspD/PulD (secretin)